MYNDITLECICDRCNHHWTARSRDNKPTVCSSCTSKLWDCGTRKFNYILCRACGINEETGLREFCILDELVSPEIITEDVFFVQEEEALFMKGWKIPTGSALLMIGSFEINTQKALKIRDLKLAYVHEKAFRVYNALNLIYKKDRHSKRLGFTYGDSEN